MKLRYCIATILALWIASSPFAQIDAQVPVFPEPLTAGGLISTFYEVRVNDFTVPVEAYKTSSYASFVFEGSVTIDIAFAEPIYSYVLSPQADRLNTRIEGGHLHIILDRPLKLILHEVNGRDEKLFLFADAPETDAPVLGSDGVLNLLDFGVDDQGERAATEQFQAALNAAGEQQATLFVPRGRYRTRELFIPSNVTLYLESGALIFADDDPTSYEPSYGYALLRVEGADNVTIRGRGVIDGRGTFWRPKGGWYGMIHASRTRNLRVEGIVLRDSATFNIWIESSTEWRFQDIKILSEADYMNTDGFDIISSYNGVIDDVVYYGTDDFSSFGSAQDHPSDVYNVTIRNAVLFTGGAFKIGTTTWMERIHHLTYEDIDVVFAEDVFLLYLVGSADYEDILFRDIRIEDIIDDPPGSRGWAGGRLFKFVIQEASWEEGSSAQLLGNMRRITLCNVTSADWGSGRSVFGGFDDGTYQYAISDLVMNNVVIEGQAMAEQDLSRFDLLASHLLDIQFRSDGRC